MTEESGVFYIAALRRRGADAVPLLSGAFAGNVYFFPRMVFQNGFSGMSPLNQLKKILTNALSFNGFWNAVALRIYDN